MGRPQRRPVFGLLAFQSQLLCEQVMGLRLRRSSMHDPSQPEFVDVYRVPFQLLAMATGGKPMARFDPTETYVEIDLGTPHAGMGSVTQVRERAYENFRVPAAAVPRRRRPARAAQQAVAVPAGSPDRRGRLRPVPEGGKVDYAGGVDRCETCSLRYRTGIRERLSAALRPGEGPERFLPALNEYQATGSAEAVNSNSRTDKCVDTEKSHLSQAVCGSGLERKMCGGLDKHSLVQSWVKNHRLYLGVPYLYFGGTPRYRPDFVVRLTIGLVVLLEGKGDPDEKDDAKPTALGGELER